MAGNFDINEGSDGINDINITPFVDVVLVLLVIFMVAAPIMVRESLKVKLPRTLTSDKSTSSPSIGLSVTREGLILVEGKVFERDAFEQYLKDKSSEDTKPQFLISGDAEAKHGDIVYVIDALKKNNLNDFAFQIERITK
jgi:biopolymer transport protein ExbD